MRIGATRRYIGVVITRRNVRVVAVIVALSLITAVPATAAVRRTRRLADGVTYTTIKQRHPRLRAHVISTRLSARPALEVALGTGELPGWERTSSMARRHRAIAAINGDYGRPSGRPVMTFARAGRLLQTPLSWGRNFALDASRRRAYIGHPNVKVSAYSHANSAALNVAKVNAGPPSGWQIAMFTPAGGYLERPPKRACSARLRPAGGAHLGPDGLPVVRGYVVERMACGYRSMFTMGGIVLSTPARGERAHRIRMLKKGSRVTLSWSLGWPRAVETVGGNPTLLEAGRIVVGHSNHPFFRRNPRTGVGTTPNGRVLLVTVDGRRPRYSRGITLKGFARLFRSLGATWALNLDGGGSTTMYVRGRGVVNRPSDGRERPVSSALLLVHRYTAPKALPVAAQPKPKPKPTPTPAPARVWSRVVGDPASTGGLADSLPRRHRLRGSLRRAAETFRR